MGITGLVRLTNAPTNGLKLIDDNIRQNHNGQIRGRWQLSARSYRSTLSALSNGGSTMERSMYLLTMNDNVFVSLEDPYAPTRADLVYHANQSQTPIVEPTHYRNTLLTLSPPGALEQLLTLLRARWISTKQSAGSAGQYKQTQLTVEGNIYAIGTDWIVRAGNVILAGGAVKGMLLEAEYLPVPTMSSQESGGSSELLSSLLLSVLPNVQDLRAEAVTISDDQWEDVLWDREAEEEAAQEAVKQVPEDDLFVVAEEDVPGHVKGDWAGVDRDRRSAYLIIGALRSDGLI
ncbi:hypothetical protein BC834DRAFT_880520 [Gloeopeniophorella convolvens]|nr:hypothetical protein BC834DRAFT_880520 [Gloeopeniophorella convolvens]